MENAEVPIKAGAVAKLLGVPRSSIYSYARAGKLPVRRLGRHCLFFASEVMEALRGNGVNGKQAKCKSNR